MAKKRVDVEIGVKNKVAAGFKSVRASIRNFSRSVKRSMATVGLSMKRVAAIGIGSFAAMIKYGNAFRASMAEVKTMLGNDKSMLPKLTKQVRELSGEFGLAKDTLAKGLYQTLSAGVPAGNAIEFLRVASKSAVGGVTDVATAVDGLTSVINAYGVEASKVSQVSDIMFSVVKEGKINFEELSQNIGNIAPFAKVAGVGIENLSAMIATLVKVDKPERAMTSLRQAMVFAAKEGKPLLQVLDEFEGKSLEDLLAAGVTQKSAAGIAIMSSNMAVLRKEMKIFENTAGAANAAFEDVGAVRGWQKLWQTVLSITSRVGDAVDKSLAPAIENLRSNLAEFISSGRVDDWANKAVAATGALVKALKSFFAIAQNIIALRWQIMWVAIAAAIGKVLIGTASLITSLGGVSAAATLATAAVVRLRIALLTLNATVVGFAIAGIAGLIGFGKAAWDANKALLELIKSQRNLKSIEDKSEETYGTRNASTLRTVRRVMASGTDEEKANLEKSQPKAVAAWRKAYGGKGAPPKIPQKIGLGGGAMGSIGGGGVSGSASMLSSGELFTMMQAGSGAKRESELSELQGINGRLDKLIEVSGGVA